MNLKAIDKLWQDREQRETARAAAGEYVAAHPAEFSKFEAMVLDELVVYVGEMREQQNEEERIRADVWLLARYAPRLITGVGGIG
jgi:hypothetical protein